MRLTTAFVAMLVSTALVFVADVRGDDAKGHKPKQGKQQQKKDEKKPEHPEWIQKKIKAYLAKGVANPPGEIVSYKYQDKTVYFTPVPNPGGMSSLFDEEGELLGHPNGGFTGRGDGNFADFPRAATERTVIWKDPRVADSQWQHWLGRVKRMEESRGPATVLKMWQFQLKQGKFKGKQKQHAEKEVARLKKLAG